MSFANIECKFSSFANYNELDYNKDDVIKVLSAFEDPTIAPGIISEIRTDGIVKKRMQFVAQNGLFLIVINSDRIDIQLTSNEKMGFSKESLVDVKETLVPRTITEILRTLVPRTITEMLQHWCHAALSKK